MRYYPPSLISLIKNIAKLPGIGEKTAERLALHILRSPRPESEALANSILHLRETIGFCSQCYSLSDGDICGICNDPGRDHGLLCVVEQPGDMVALEKSGGYSGVYHVLSGVLSPLDGIGPEEIKIKELVEKIRSGQVREVVLATSTSVEGESTSAYIADLLKRFDIKISRIASGVPVGGELKYVDQVTLRRAMEARRDI